MLLPAIAEIFKYKLVSTVFVLTCWSNHERVKLIRQLSAYNIKATISCNPEDIEQASNHQLHGVLYFSSSNFTTEVNRDLFGYWYKWVIVGDILPPFLNGTRYDADVVIVEQPLWEFDNEIPTTVGQSLLPASNGYKVSDVYIHPTESPTIHPWAFWNPGSGLRILYDRDRILRRWNLKKHPIRIATPLGSYTNDSYDGTFLDYLLDVSMPERDSGVRVGYLTSSLMAEALNATGVLIPTMLWGTELNNSSMTLKLRLGTADISGAILRILDSRVRRLDFPVSLWPFHVGFTYLAERESSSNMFAEPFTPGVWWCCLGLFFILALAQRVTAKSPMEKEGAYYAVLATCLQQDASAVPQGVSGRWTFLVLSISGMLIHAYYTSAIVSALMSAGRGTLDSLRALGDSKYAIASEDYDYMRFFMFDTKTNWSDMEYLKQKKMTSRFYQDIQRGVELIQEGQTAYHTEYNQLYPHLKSFTDDEICKIQHVDTIPETLTYLTATRFGQWKNLFRITGIWLHETGHIKRIVTILRVRPPPCRAALLAERVNIDDVAPVVIITIAGAVASVVILLCEIIYSKFKGRNKTPSMAGLVQDQNELDE